MKEYTYSEARQLFSMLLKMASKEGAVRIRKRNGQVYTLRPEKRSKSPLDVQGLNLNIKREEIIDCIRSGRRPE